MLFRSLGAILVAVSDSGGTLSDANGIDIAQLTRIKDGGGAVLDYPRGTKGAADAISAEPCDIWIPAARPDVLDAGNAARLNARLVLQGANIPFTLEAERLLHERGVIVVPDFVANAGGVICAAMEHRGATRAAAFDAIAEKVAANTTSTLHLAREAKLTPRAAATGIALERVREAMNTRRFGVL